MLFWKPRKDKLHDNIHNNMNAISSTKTVTMFRKFIDLCFPSDVDAESSIWGRFVTFSDKSNEK